MFLHGISDRTTFVHSITTPANRVPSPALRGTTEQITDVVGIIQDILESADLRVMWDKYRKQFGYAKDISYERILEVLRDICRELT